MELVEYLKFSTGSEKADIDNYKLGECYDLIQEFIEHDRAEQLIIYKSSLQFNAGLKMGDKVILDKSLEVEVLNGESTVLIKDLRDDTLIWVERVRLTPESV